jgi:DNA polymerase III delta subunit
LAKQDPKQIQRELEKKTVSPVYWAYGPETLKARELGSRILKTLQDESKNQSFVWIREVLEGSEIEGAELADLSQSMSLLGEKKFYWVRDAHLIKDTESLKRLMGGAKKIEELDAVLFFMAKDLDLRKKFSKELIDLCPVIECGEIPERDRVSWIEYLAKRENLTELSGAMTERLAGLDPWSLDIVRSEIQKMVMLKDVGTTDDELVDLIAGQCGVASEAFIDAFLSKNVADTQRLVVSFSEQPELALPLMGLMAWNLRHLVLLKSGAKSQLKLNPYVVQKLDRYLPKWTVGELKTAQENLAQVDFLMKQTPRPGLGIWASFAMQSL